MQLNKSFNERCKKSVFQYFLLILSCGTLTWVDLDIPLLSLLVREAADKFTFGKFPLNRGAGFREWGGDPVTPAFYCVAHWGVQETCWMCW